MDDGLKDAVTLLSAISTDHMVFLISLASLALMAFALFVIMRVVGAISKGKG